jgi:formate/nitrite transporter FocA (FNT family)
MVWLLPGAESARVSIIIISTYLVGLGGGLNHIIAGSTTMLYLVATHAISWNTYFTAFFLPPILGNIVGAVSLVAALGRAQVVGGKD